MNFSDPEVKYAPEWFEEELVRIVVANHVRDCIYNGDVVLPGDNSILISKSKYLDVDQQGAMPVDCFVKIDVHTRQTLGDIGLVSLLGAPSALDSIELTDSEILELIHEALNIDTSNVVGLVDGMGAEVITLLIRNDHDGVSRKGHTGRYEVNYHFRDIHLRAMSVRDFGDFLYALKHCGEEVAVATLVRIYRQRALARREESENYTIE